MLKYDFKKIEEKWQYFWKTKKNFEADSDPKKKKFFVNFPYPYINLSPHIGHFYTLMRVEAFARYKRLQGYNVLFAQGWHATGSPIISAAQRIKEKEPKQIAALKKEGFSDKEIEKFEEPTHWINVFSKRWEEDLTRLGLGIDWRRNFITTSLNPHYDKFVRWQFNKLKEKGYVAKGSHPVVWDPKTNMPAGDHDRVKGEGETPQEFTLLKFKMKDGSFIVAATLRPETVFGQTNMWVNPDIEYVKAKIDDETWIISKPCAEKLKNQDKEVSIQEKVQGKKLLGQYCTAPGIKREIIILPSYFCDPNIGTGLVTSVPSHAPYDWIGLYDLQKDDKLAKKFGLPYNEIKKIKPIALINLPGWDEHPAIQICERLNITSQKEAEKLEKAKKEIYKEEHFKGVMNKNSGKYKGMKVEEAKEAMKEDLIKSGDADIIYELTEEVVSRSLTPCIVKLVKDQWFIKYGDKNWKKNVHKDLKNVTLYPESVRSQFEYVIDWLKDWACTREFGLGTRLPFDENWLIESLSDSTVYMAYYTIAHLIKELDITEIEDDFFDYIFFGKGKGKKEWGEMKQEFDYWYPVDFRNSGKDLVQNHLTFFLFNHDAIFPKKMPQSIGVNGWVRVDNQKMSKSLGNIIPLKTMAEEFGADASRLTILNGGEELDDPNWDSNFAKNLQRKLDTIYTTVLEQENYSKKTNFDDLTESKSNQLIKEVTGFMEKTLFRSAIQKIFIDYWKLIKDYLQKTQGEPTKELYQKLVKNFTIMLHPFAPHFCEELWEHLEKGKAFAEAKWPKVEENKINKEIEEKEKKVEKTISDIHHIIPLFKGKKEPKKVYLYVLPNEKELFEKYEPIIQEKTSLETKVFSVSDKEKYDPENKAKKAKPGKPAIFLE